MSTLTSHDLTVQLYINSYFLLQTHNMVYVHYSDCSDIKSQYQMYSLYTNNMKIQWAGMTWFSKSSHRDKVHFVTLPFNTSIISFLLSNIWKLAFLGTEYISSVVEAQHLIMGTAWENIKQHIYEHCDCSRHNCGISQTCIWNDSSEMTVRLVHCQNCYCTSAWHMAATVTFTKLASIRKAA